MPPLRLLAIDTSTHLLSVGVRVVSPAAPLTDTPPPAQHPHGTPWAEAATPADTDQQWLHTGEGGAQASAQLVPAVLALLAQAGTSLAELDALVWGRGPGSFTGLRTAAAVAQGLAYGTRTARHPDGLPVLSVDTLLAVAEEARHQLYPPAHASAASAATSAAAPAATPASTTACTITALLDARMDEVYAAIYHFADAHHPVATPQGGPWLLKPEDLATLLDAGAGVPEGAGRTGRTGNVGAAAWAGVLAGNVFEVYGDRIPATSGPRLSAMPTAAALLRLAPGLLAQGLATRAADAQPVYVRDKVAQTTAERSPRPPAQATTPTVARTTAEPPQP